MKIKFDQVDLHLWGISKNKTYW